MRILTTDNIYAWSCISGSSCASLLTINQISSVWSERVAWGKNMSVQAEFNFTQQPWFWLNTCAWASYFEEAAHRLYEIFVNVFTLDLHTCLLPLPLLFGAAYPMWLADSQELRKMFGWRHHSKKAFIGSSMPTLERRSMEANIIQKESR